MGLMLPRTCESLLRMRTVHFLKNFTFFYTVEPLFSPNLLCIFWILKMKAVGACTGFGFWGILKNPTIRFASKLNQCFLWSLRSHSWSLGVFFHFYHKKKLPKSCPVSFSWILMPKTAVEAFLRFVDSQFDKQLTFFNFWFCKSYGTCYNFRSAWVWCFRGRVKVF